MGNIIDVNNCMKVARNMSFMKVHCQLLWSAEIERTVEKDKDNNNGD